MAAVPQTAASRATIARRLAASALGNPTTLALPAKVEYREDPRSGLPQHCSGKLIVRLDDGHKMRHREQVNCGAADRPFSNAEVEAKFMDKPRLGGGEATAKRVREAVLAPEDTSARELEDALVG